MKVAKENSLAEAVVGQDLCPFYAPQTLAILRQKADYCPWGALNKQYFLPKLAFVEKFTETSWQAKLYMKSFSKLRHFRKIRHQDEV